jgi:hypothetical protein
VQSIELVLLVAGAVVGVALLAAWLRRRAPHDARLWMTVLLGVVAGIVGIALVVVPDIDTVPDDTESVLLVVVVVGVSLALAAGTVYRLTHR